VKELKFKELKLTMQIWTAMMNDGKESTTSFSHLLTDGEKLINPYPELLKTLLFMQKKHTVPALGLAVVERFKTPNPDKYIAMGNKLREKLQAMLGKVENLFI
jgi:hypothetical protein